MELTSPKFAFKMLKLQYPSDFSRRWANRALLCRFLIMQKPRPNAVTRAGPGAWFRGALFPGYLVNLELGLAQTLQGTARPSRILLQRPTTQAEAVSQLT